MNKKERGMRVPPTFREQYGPGSKLASWSVPILNPQRKEQIGEMPGELLHGLPHMLVLHKYFLFCIFLFLLLCRAHFFQTSVATTGDSSLYLHERYIVSKLGK